MVSRRSRLLAVAATVLVALAGLSGVSAPQAQAAVVASCENAGCPDPTGWAKERWKAHAGYPSHGGTVDGANCTNYVAWRLLKNGATTTAVSGLGNATTWATRAASRGVTVNKSPAVGAVAHWSSNHVAYVEQVNANGTIVISESNVWVGDPTVRKWLRHRTIQASAVDNFIHLKDVITYTALDVFSAGDFDRDGRGDLFAVRSDGALKLYRGDGAGGFRSTGTRIGTSASWSKFAHLLAPGDFTGDKRADLLGVTADGKLWLYRGNGKGGFYSGRTQIGHGWARMLFVFSPGDFSGDKRADVLAVTPAGELKLYSGNGSGRFRSGSRVIGTGFAAAVWVGSVGDVDGDARPDVLALDADGTLRMYAGNGKGALLDRTGIVIGTGWTGVTTLTGRGDLTGDTRADLLALQSAGTLNVRANDGAGGFLSPGTQVGVTW